MKRVTKSASRYWTMAQVVNLLKKGIVPKYQCRRKDWTPGRFIQRSPASDSAIVELRTGCPLRPWSPTINDLQAGDWRVEEPRLNEKKQGSVPRETNHKSN